MKRLEVLDTPINDPVRQITSITGLEYAVNLKELNLDYNKITDLSPISNLTKLEKLNISYNKGLESISCLSVLTNLNFVSGDLVAADVLIYFDNIVIT